MVKSIFNLWDPDGKYSILAVGFPSCRHGLYKMETDWADENFVK